MKPSIIALASVLVLLTIHPALAQRSAGSKMLGTAYDMWSSGTYFDHAYDHAVVLQNYAASGEGVPQEIVQRHAAAVRGNLTAAKKAYANVAAAHKDDNAVAKHLAAIDEHHAKALAMCDKMDAAGAKGEGKAGDVHACCAGAAASIKAARAEHEKLMKHLNVAKPSAEAKPGAIQK
jgi:hypothetical protein